MKIVVDFIVLKVRDERKYISILLLGEGILLDLFSDVVLFDSVDIWVVLEILLFLEFVNLFYFV